MDPTGGYLVGIVDVTPREVWDICVALDHAVLLAEVQDPSTQCGSYANNPKRYTVYVCPGPCSGMGRAMEVLHNCVYCRHSTKGRTIPGACICNGGQDYCFASSCAIRRD